MRMKRERKNERGVWKEGHKKHVYTVEEKGKNRRNMKERHTKGRELLLLLCDFLSDYLALSRTV